MKLACVFLVFALTACAYGLTVEEQWTNFKVFRYSFNHFVFKRLINLQTLFERKYNAEEDKTRFVIFKKSVEYVEQQNAKFARGESNFGAAINEFSDHTEAEKQQRQGLFVPTPA
jgi:Cathepsin propeptide inhibitor domain (I29)